jgi:hypothetical protein
MGRSPSESEFDKSAIKSLFIDPNPGDLTMSRMKLG